MKPILAIFIVFLSLEINALPIKFRAREHFIDNHVIKFKDGTQTEYGGLSNTLNIWYEIPFHYSLGLSLSPIIGSPSTKDPLATLGSKIQLQVCGIEGKYYPVSGFKGFVRGGLGYTRLSASGVYDGVNGSSYYIGLGWEFPVWKIHLAPEIALRKSQLSDGVEIDSTIFSIGFHFYKGLSGK